MSEFQMKLESMVDLFQDDFKQVVRDTLSKWRNGERPVRYYGEYFSDTWDFDGWRMGMIRDSATPKFNCNVLNWTCEGKIKQAHITSVDPHVIPKVLDLFPTSLKLATLNTIENFKNGNREQKNVRYDDNKWMFDVSYGISLICTTSWNDHGEIVSVNLYRCSAVVIDEEFLNVLFENRYILPD